MRPDRNKKSTVLLLYTSPCLSPNNKSISWSRPLATGCPSLSCASLHSTSLLGYSSNRLTLPVLQAIEPFFHKACRSPPSYFPSFSYPGLPFPYCFPLFFSISWMTPCFLTCLCAWGTLTRAGTVTKHLFWARHYHRAHITSLNSSTTL